MSVRASVCDPTSRSDPRRSRISVGADAEHATSFSDCVVRVKMTRADSEGSRQSGVVEDFRRSVVNLEKVTPSDRSSLLSCDGDGCAPQSEILAISKLKDAPLMIEVTSGEDHSGETEDDQTATRHPSFGSSHVDVRATRAMMARATFTVAYTTFLG